MLVPYNYFLYPDNFCTHHLPCVSRQSARVVSSPAVPDLDEPVTTAADNFLLVKLTTVHN